MTGDLPRATTRWADWRARLRRARHVWRLRRSGLFDGAWYLEQNPELASAGVDPVRHYLLFGGFRGRDPGPRFSSAAYLAANRDVAAAGVNPLLHYVMDGWASGRPLRPGPHEPLLLSRRQMLGWQDWIAAIGLQPLLRQRRVLLPPPGPSVGSLVRVETARGVMPTGWALVRADVPGLTKPTALHVIAGGVTRQIAVPTDGSAPALVHLPNQPTQLALTRGAGARSATARARHPALEVREIGALEGLLRAWITLRRRTADPDAAESDATRPQRDPPASLAAAFEPTDAHSYAQWVRLYDTPSDADLARLSARAQALAQPPRFSLIVPIYNTPAAALAAMIASVQAQIYPHWELCLADDASNAPHVATMLDEAAGADRRVRVARQAVNGGISAASNAALAIATGDWAALLDHDDVLPAHALAVMAESIAAHPDSDVFYSDEDKLDANGQRYEPYFKPNFSPELLHGQNLISHLGVYRMALVRRLGGFRGAFDGSQDYDLALRATAATRAPVIHVPHVLYHWRLYPGAGTFSSTQQNRAATAARAAISDQLAAAGETVTVAGGVGLFHRAHYPDPARWPLVTAIVPTRDGLDVLRPCLLGLLDQTDYPALEILVADNGSTQAETLAFLDEMTARGVRVLTRPGPFNYSALNNESAAAATGEMLLFLNNDISVMEAGWLKEMVRLALRPQVGAVGAKLLYPDGSLQHGGVVLGMGGVAGHVHLGVGPEDDGYYSCLAMTHEVSAVTAACMLVPVRHFAAIGGFDAANLPVAFNDVDLCLRLREAGLRILWTPHAALHHWESRTRGDDFARRHVDRFIAEIDHMRRRWGAELASDPFYSPNLSLDSYDPLLAFPPRVARPWSDPHAP